MDSLSNSEFLTVRDHVFLPPKLPKEDDANPSIEKAILAVVKDALRQFHSSSSPAGCPVLEKCCEMVNQMDEILSGTGFIDEAALNKALAGLGVGDVLAIHVRAQNAGLIIRKLPEHYLFEGFELSSSSGSVMSCNGRLVRNFPDAAVTLGHEIFDNHTFREQLVSMISSFQSSSFASASATSRKAGAKVAEVRDTASSSYVTHFMLLIIGTLGAHIEPAHITKRVRDEVVYESTLIPWRRSPLWLLLRVALQKTLQESDAKLNTTYKSFMLSLMASMTYALLPRLNQASCDARMEDVFIMLAKLHRRLQKLGNDCETSTARYVQSVMDAGTNILEQNWRAAESRTSFASDLFTKLRSLNPQSDTLLSLNNFHTYMDERKPGAAPSKPSSSFQPVPTPCLSFDSQGLPTNLLQSSSDHGRHIILTEVEMWVEDCLPGWMAQKTPVALPSLGGLINSYNSLAVTTYSGNPEGLSIMILTLMDLWTALDKWAIAEYPMLVEYSVGFPMQALSKLLLPQRKDVDRLVQIEAYLKGRAEKSNSSLPSIFGSFGDKDSFGVRFFATSSSMKARKQSVEDKAQVARNERLARLEKLKQEHQELDDRYSEMTCEYWTDTKRGRRWTRHSGNCGRCAVKHRMDSMSITVHEWPLPRHGPSAQAAIFETLIPQNFAVWRDITYRLFARSFSTVKPTGSSGLDKLYDTSNILESDLYGHFSHSKVVKASSLIKPFTSSHYKSCSIDQAVNNGVVFECALCLQMYDSSIKSLASSKFLIDLTKVCSYKLQDKSFMYLQMAVDTTTHSSNYTLAKQHQCPSALTMHEHYAFATVRSGNRLQWRNLATNIVSRNLNFSLEETQLVVLQAIWEAGPPRQDSAKTSTICRDSHVDLQELDFSTSLLQQLNTELVSVEHNWENQMTAYTLLLLACRVLAMTDSQDVARLCYGFISKARQVFMRWMRELEALLHDCKEDSTAKQLKVRLLCTALSVHATFPIEPRHFDSLLSTENDYVQLGECCIIIHDNTPADLNSLAYGIRLFVQRYWKSSVKLEERVRSYFLQNPQSTDRVIKSAWSGYPGSVSWKRMLKPRNRWLTTETVNDAGKTSMSIHFKPLDGSLLVDGSPLTRLPKNYEEHEIYKRLFGEKVLEVAPSSMSGLDFEVRTLIEGHQVFLGMKHSQLIVRYYKDGNVCEALPLVVLRGDIPDLLVDSYIHWYNIVTRIVEFRPRSSPWISTYDWHMNTSMLRNSSLKSSLASLVDIRSSTTSLIVSILQGIESTRNIILRVERDQLQISLPRYNLEFFMSDGYICSKQFRGMVIDDDQNIGTLSGLTSKLVLKSRNRSDRLLIVPYGKVRYKLATDHVTVSIDHQKSRSVQYFTYDVDSKLGRLSDRGNLKTRLFKVYLHAVTSSHLCDSLTGKTGTEEAIDGLRSSALRSFLKIDADELDLLRKISSLTPMRTFYPSHLKNMQIVNWDPQLSPLSQHEYFLTEVQSIIDHAATLKIFQMSSLDESLEVNHPGHSDLLQRAIRRYAWLRVGDYGGQADSSNADRVYRSRVIEKLTERSLQTSNMIKLVQTWTSDIKVNTNLLQTFVSWNAVIQGPRTQTSSFATAGSSILGFSLHWFEGVTTLQRYWCELHEMLGSCDPNRDRFRIMMSLATFVYSVDDGENLAKILLMLATNPKLRLLKPPVAASFKLSEGAEFDRSKLKNLLDDTIKTFESSPESTARITAESGETGLSEDEIKLRRVGIWESNVKEYREKILAELSTQWPASSPSFSKNTKYRVYFNFAEFIVSARDRFESWYDNLRFQNYILSIQTVLNTTNQRIGTGSTINQMNPLANAESSKPLWNQHSPSAAYSHKQVGITLGDLMKTAPAPLVEFQAVENLGFKEAQTMPGILPADGSHLSSKTTGMEEAMSSMTIREASTDKLEAMLLSMAAASEDAFEKSYIQDLQISFSALTGKVSTHPNNITASSLEDNLNHRSEESEKIRQDIRESLSIAATQSKDVHFWRPMLPRLTTSTLLSYLAWNKRKDLTERWYRVLIRFARSILAVQRAQRLNYAKSFTDLFEEIANVGHQNWNSYEHPDWLLLELENRICIRDAQSQVAAEMMSPSSGRNSVMQLNMGLGKSSVIVPIVASSLADGQKLVRVIVLKPLAMQMYNLLVQRLGGLLNRQIYYMPITRALKLNTQDARQVHSLYEKCLKTGGVLLCQPDHLLSFELLGYSSLIASNLALGNRLVATQKWLNNVTRDVVDESDEVFSVRFELTYAEGTQNSIEHSPDRWLICQEVLLLLNRLIYKHHEANPEGFEVSQPAPGAFNRIRFLTANAAEDLLLDLATEICEKGIRRVMIPNLSYEMRTIILQYITNRDVSGHALSSLKASASITDHLKNSVLLLRGLFSHGILNFAFSQKRWRVNYGLDLDPPRSMLAIPYSAKDTPTARAEFSHPDTTIILTCLSYFYGGLTDRQILASFQRLLLSDQSQEEYDNWVQSAPNLPVSFHQLKGINLSNLDQCRQDVFPHLKFSTGIIKFYMSNMVFPKEMKEFPYKLSSSGWDIGKNKTFPTTGFSGTNDARHILPLSIEQHDLPDQLYTNALVLSHLLQPENCYEDVQRATGETLLSAKVLMNLATSLRPSVRVILDVGAQVLELRNEEMASTWLKQVSITDADAVIFVDDNNEICVLDRSGRSELLSISPFASQMDRCLVYLDEAHTRGIDLKMPSDYRAIVTLGPNLTKDRLVQACMRMRQLGKGQSVVFCSSVDIKRKILEYSENKTDVQVADVLRWAMKESCATIKRYVPLWTSQGFRHQKRYETLDSLSQLDCTNVKALLEPEAKSLQQRYSDEGVDAETEKLQDFSTTVDSSRAREYAAIRKKCSLFSVSSLISSTLQEEQERELAPENEREQQTELPPSYEPLPHKVCEELVQSVNNGFITHPVKVMKSAFASLIGTTAMKGGLYDPKAWPRDLLVTDDFEQTVKPRVGGDKSWFIRPVQWIVSFPRKKLASKRDYVIISPFEAQSLVPLIRDNTKGIILHNYAPRSTRSVGTLEHLSYGSLPAVPKGWSPDPMLILQLNLFAGQLYLADYGSYKQLCDFLGLRASAVAEGVDVHADGFIDPKSRRETQEHSGLQVSPFSRSPIPFLRELFRMRRKDLDFAASDMGKIINGEMLKQYDFEQNSI